jgi:trimethylamine--corrinoid protein Co-methyltransferase
MNRAIINVNQHALDTIHTYSLELLKETGIRFPCEKALDLFKKHGFRVENQMVFFKEDQIAKALASVPPRFSIRARNRDRDIIIGGEYHMMAPGYGPPFIIDPDGAKRNALLEDVHKFCKLVQTSKWLDFNSSIVVQPNDVPMATAHLDILLATLIFTDKPIMGISSSEKAAEDSLRLSEIVWGRTDEPVMISLVDSLSPLQYAPDSVEALIVFAAAGQPVIVHSACTLGSTGPITIAGSLVVSNATTLAGICLTQLIRPGTPVVYGLGGTPMEMRTGGYINASPEDVKHTAIAGALGRYYNMPCRSQGALTESFCLDYQAGMESAMMMTAAAISGANVTLHACGTYGSMLAMSYEKFLADEDLIGSLKKLILPIEFTENAFAMDMIKRLGTSGEYLMEDHTALRCRNEFFTPALGIRAIHSKWMDMNPRDLSPRAGNLLTQRLEGYVKPDIDPTVEKDLAAFVDHHKG